VTPDLTVVLVNYNAGGELRHALRSVVAHLGDLTWDAVVVDNASIDGSDTIADEFAPRVRLIRNDRNVGFGAGVNQGARSSEAPLLLVMNPDCRLTADAVGALRAVLEREPTCAVVGPRVLDPDGVLQGSARGDPDMLTGLFGRTSWLGAHLPFLHVARRNVAAEAAIDTGRPSVAVDWVSGACLLVRRAAFDAVGGFDERYFLYWEDADVCRRLRDRGYEVHYVPGATVIHQVGRSSQTARASSIRAFHASAYLYYVTHVASGALDPRRYLARALLALRCSWKVRASRADARLAAPVARPPTRP
jgi:GT2 family glycosyltransferase